MASSSAERIGPFILGSTLGEGATGKVKLAVHKDTGQRVAIKIIAKSKLTAAPNLRRKVEREIAVMRLFSHPFVIKLYDVLQTKQFLFLVLEHVEGGELFDYIVQKGRLSLEEAFHFFKQIILGLEYCHNLLICHRDLKPENLLLDRNKNIKIADFGMAGLMEAGSDKLLETSCGSPHYASPEVVRGEKYNGLYADVWSVGIILYALLTGRLPFDDDNIKHLLQKVKTGQYLMPSFLPDDVKHLISRMLWMNPKERITLLEIKSHPWWKRMSKLEKASKAPVPQSGEVTPSSTSTPNDHVKTQEKALDLAIVNNGNNNTGAASSPRRAPLSPKGPSSPQKSSAANYVDINRGRSPSISPPIQLNALKAEIVDLEAEAYPIDPQDHISNQEEPQEEPDTEQEDIEYEDPPEEDEQQSSSLVLSPLNTRVKPDIHFGIEDSVEKRVPAVDIKRINVNEQQDPSCEMSELNAQLQRDDMTPSPSSSSGFSVGGSQEPDSGSNTPTPRKTKKPMLHRPIEVIDEDIFNAIVALGWKDEAKLRDSLMNKKTNIETVLYRLLEQRRKENGSLKLESFSPQMSVTPSNPITDHVDNAAVLRQRLAELRGTRQHQEQQIEMSSSPKKTAWFAFWRKKPTPVKKEETSTFGLHSSKTQQAIVNELARSFKVLQIHWSRISESVIRAKFSENNDNPVEFDISMTALPNNGGFLLNFSRVAGDILTARVLFDVLQQELNL